MIDFYIEDGTLYRRDDTPIRAATPEEEQLWLTLMQLSTPIPHIVRADHLTETDREELMVWADQPGKLTLIRCPLNFSEKEK